MIIASVRGSPVPAINPRVIPEDLNCSRFLEQAAGLFRSYFGRIPTNGSPLLNSAEIPVDASPQTDLDAHMFAGARRPSFVLWGCDDGEPQQSHPGVKAFVEQTFGGAVIRMA